MNQYHFEFSGKIIERGFWIYTYKIINNNTTYFYVGRTGDSSSPHEVHLLVECYLTLVKISTVIH